MAAIIKAGQSLTTGTVVDFLRNASTICFRVASGSTAIININPTTAGDATTQIKVASTTFYDQFDIDVSKIEVSSGTVDYIAMG